MKRNALLHIPLFLSLILALPRASYAQLIAGPGVSDATSSQPISSHNFSFSGTIPGQLDGALSVTFSIYSDQQSATALWTETQVVQVTGEKYPVMLGSTSATGLPSEIFSADQAHWLGVQVNGAEKRFLLVSVPYAMKAVNADQLGGLPFSEYVTAQQLQAALQGATTGTVPQPKTITTAPTGQAAAAGTPPQPATDFTDNNASEVLLVTQQGTGFAIHAITSSQAEAILAQNDSIGGTALHAFATNATGTSIGVLAETASPDGIAGEFNNRSGGKILSLRSNGVEVASVDSNGNLTANGQMQAQNFIGGGFGLFGIPPSAINATPLNNPFSVVQRDFDGSFAANQVTATTFSGGGFGLFGIPPSAINATPLNNAFSVVQRDFNGSFAANQVTASTFSGGGFGLFGIPPSAINATPLNNPFSVVQRDFNGGFAAGNLQVMNQLTSSGLVDFTGAVTAPVRTVLTANIPPLCSTSKELLLVTDAFPGQQLFVCNSNGNGWVLLGDGSSGSANASGNTTGSLQIFTQLGTGTGLTVSAVSGTGLNTSSTNGTALAASTTNGTALTASSADQVAIQAIGNSIGIQASSRAGIGLWAAAEATDNTGTSLLLTNSGPGKLISGGQSSFPFLQFETFGVDTLGNVDFNGALMSPYEPTGNWLPNSLVKLTSSSGVFASATVTTTSPGDMSGAIGIITGIKDGNFVLVAQGGRQDCVFDGIPQMGDYVGISQLQPGQCTDLGLAFPTNGVQIIGRVTFSSASPLGTVLLFGPDQHAASSTNFSLTAADPSILIGGTPTSPTVEVADGGITSAKLAPNAVTSANIADGSLSPAKIAGTVATLGANSFSGSQTIQQNLTVNGVINNSLGIVTSNSVFAAGGNFTGSTNGQLLTVQNTNSAGSAMLVNGNVGIGVGGTVQAINASSGNGIGIRTSSSNSYGLFASSTNAIGAHVEGGTFGLEAVSSTNGSALKAFGVGNAPIAIFDSNIVGPGITLLSGRRQGGETFAFDNAGNWSSQGGLTVTYPNNTTTGTFVQFLTKLDSTGAAVVASTSDTSGIVGIEVTGSGTSGQAHIVYSGMASCNFDGTAQIGHYVGISTTQGGRCTDVGALYPPLGQIIGRVVSLGLSPQVYNVLVFGQPQRDSNPGTITAINTGAGLTGGPISSSGTISIANNGVTNAMLQNNSVTVTSGTGLSGGGLVTLGGSVTLSNAGALSFNGRTGTIVSASGDYSFNQISGAATAAQLPPTTAFRDQSNTFTANQIINGTVTASSFAGDGSALTNVSAATIGTLGSSDIATNIALSAETTARQNTDTAIQSSVASETGARQSADTTLLNNINAETSARASADASLQANINSVSSASAQLAAPNSFTAKQTLVASTTTSASLNVPAGSVPSAPAAGDVWNTGSTLQYRDNASTTRSLVSTTQSGGLQLLKLTASITPASVGSQGCTEQSFTVSGISTGDVLLSVLQPSTSSPGANIAIGGFRISAANTVAVQFCNVSRNNSTPTAGVYTFAFMR